MLSILLLVFHLVKHRVQRGSKLFIYAMLMVELVEHFVEAIGKHRAH
jgi:hypothetical protein